MTALRPNPEKKLKIETPWGTYCRFPIKTKVVYKGDVLTDIMDEYVMPFVKEGDMIFISEKIVAISQGRAFDIDEIKPSRLAKILCKFVYKSPYGIGLGSPWTMELALRDVGAPKILFAAFCSAVMQVSQDGPVDMLMYYDARPNTSFNGLFDFTTFSTLPTYYSFYAWKKLRDLGTKVYSSTGGLECVYVTAAKGPDGRMAILVTNCAEDKNKIAPCTFDIELRNTHVKQRKPITTLIE